MSITGVPFNSLLLNLNKVFIIQSSDTKNLREHYGNIVDVGEGEWDLVSFW